MMNLSGPFENEAAAVSDCKSSGLSEGVLHEDFQRCASVSEPTASRENEVPNKQVLDGNGWKLYRETPYASVKAS
jgi:hypothetical protein